MSLLMMTLSVLCVWQCHDKTKYWVKCCVAGSITGEVFWRGEEGRTREEEWTGKEARVAAKTGGGVVPKPASEVEK